MPDGLFQIVIGIIATVLSWWFTFSSPAITSLQASFRWIGISWMLLGLGQMTLDVAHSVAIDDQRIELMVMGGLLCAAGVLLMIGFASREFRRVQRMIERSEAKFEASRENESLETD